MINKTRPIYIIDIGACVGLFIDHCLSKYTIGKIYAYEPLRVNYKYLQNKYKNDHRVEIFPQAVSNFNGHAPIYKKKYIQKKWGILPLPHYDFAGNAGSSLNMKKSNVSWYKTESVKVTQIDNIMKKINQPSIDILKIDSEGSEYDILSDVLNFGLYKRIKKIYYEDHTRKIPGLVHNQQKFLQQIKHLGIIHKFHMQGEHLTYTPLASIINTL